MDTPVPRAARSGGSILAFVAAGVAVAVGLSTARGRAAIAAAVPSLVAPQLSDRPDMMDAIDRAKDQNKRVLLDFNASWCGACRAMAAAFETPTVKPYLDEHFILVSVSVESAAGKELSRKYGDPARRGLPTLVALGPDGRVAATESGLRGRGGQSVEQAVLVILQKLSGS
jgi:thiol:disulfide interchange protein